MRRPPAFLQADPAPSTLRAAEDPFPRKLIFYTHALAGGGAERVWAQLASGFARRGCEVVFAVDAEASENYGFLDPAVRLIVLGGGHLAAVRRLAALIRREKPDALLSALCISNLKATLAAAAAGALRRTVLSYHGFAVSERQRLSQLSYRLTPLLSRLTGATIAVSDALRDDLVARWRADRRRLQRIYNPIDSGRAPSREELARRPPRVLAIGRLEKQKNFADVLRALAAIPFADASLDILGEGPERAALEALIAELGLEGRVGLAGYQPTPWDYYRQARCFVSASGAEAFSLVVAEALAYGLPVVSSDARGPHEILAGGRYGALVPVGDVAAFARAMTAALEDPGDPAPRVSRSEDFGLQRALDAYSATIAGLTGAGAAARAS